ncbi:Alpha/Beta hydrolase protein [Xylariales sp. AK1849]|nr:Alpha/Beta hydrolase protein [Xylariales sp. AK1849]
MENAKSNNGFQERFKGRIETLKIVLPRIPFVLRVILLHILKISEPSKYLNLKSNVTVSFLRSLLGQSRPEPISKTQALTLKDPGIKGRIWVSAVASQVPPETSICDALLSAIDSMKKEWVPGDGKCRIPEIVSVEAEWTGYRAAATPDSRPPQITEDEKYHEMMKEVKSSTTVLYFHGGAYYLCDPITHRPSTKKLAKLTGGRVYSVRYRLVPQHPFPAAVLDALVSYFTLLYPPHGAVHDAVSPKDIVFAGDSAGGHLALALLQTLLELRRQKLEITWFGEKREVPLPAGLALNSPWLDIVQSLPSWTDNLKWDYLPAPNMLADRKPPADHIWPASPPRKHLYADDAYLLHPLVSLQLAASWEGSPPVYVCAGWECLADEDKYLVSKLTKDGVTVVFEEYEAMPHVFAPILGNIPEARRCFEGWSRFISAAVENPDSLASSYTTIKAKTCEEVDIDVEKLSPFTEEDLRKLAYKMVERKSDIPEVPAKL